MSRKLPLVGGNGTGSNAAPRHRAERNHAEAVVTTLVVDRVPAIAVVGAHASVRPDVFVNHLAHGLERRGRALVIERGSEPMVETRLLVIVGSHVPRALRDPGAQALWERADVLLADPSAIVAEALAAAL